MNIKNIKDIVNSPFPDEVVEKMLLHEIAKDKKAIPYVLNLLSEERKLNSEILTDMNLELSRSHMYIEEKKETVRESKKDFNKSFVVGKIEEFYTKYKDNIYHCFNRFK